MSWALRIEHQPDGLRLRFPEPLATLDMTSETAQHLASLLAIEARHRLQGVVAELAAPVELLTPNRRFHPTYCNDDCCLNGDHHAREP